MAMLAIVRVCLGDAIPDQGFHKLDENGNVGNIAFLPENKKISNKNITSSED